MSLITVYCYLTTVVYHTFILDVFCLLYAVYTYWSRMDDMTIGASIDERQWFLLCLCLAKYHGLSINLSLCACHWSVCKNLHTQLETFPFLNRLVNNDQDQDDRVFQKKKIRGTSLLNRRYTVVRIQPHIIYGVRFVFSVIVHTLVHVLKTHRFPVFSSLSSSLTVDIFTRPVDHELSSLSMSWFHLFWSVYRWTITGYLLLILAMLMFFSGHRLVGFVRRHSLVRTFHVMFFLVTVVLFCVHSSNYFMITITLLLVFADTICSLGFVRRLDVDSVTVYRSPEECQEQQQRRNGQDFVDNNVVMEIAFTSCEYAWSGICGDHVRMYVPSVSIWETHSFAVIPHISADVVTSTDSRKNIRFRIVIRVVGTWTRKLFNSRSTLTRVWICGQLTNFTEMRVMKTFQPENTVRRQLSCRQKSTVRSEARQLLNNFNFIETSGSSFNCPVNYNVGMDRGDDGDDLLCSWPSRYTIDNSLQLCLVCTGLSITRHLALLTHYVKQYAAASSVSTPCCYSLIRELPDEIVLPAQIKLIWSVSQAFDLNIAIRHLDRLQRCMVQSGWQSVLTYDIFVSRLPTSWEMITNDRLQSYMMADETYTYGATVTSGTETASPLSGAVKRCDQGDYQQITYHCAVSDNDDDEEPWLTLCTLKRPFKNLSNGQRLSVGDMHSNVSCVTFGANSNQSSDDFSIPMQSIYKNCGGADEERTSHYYIADDSHDKDDDNDDDDDNFSLIVSGVINNYMNCKLRSFNCMNHKRNSSNQRFPRFYNSTRLVVGQRVGNWSDRLLTIDEESPDSISSQQKTVVILTTGVRRIIDDLTNFAADKNNLYLYTESLW